MKNSLLQCVTFVKPPQRRLAVTSALGCALALAVTFAPQLSFAAQLYPSGKGHQVAATVRLPLVSGWYNGQEILYIQTEASDQGLAQSQGATYVPRLVNAIPTNGAASPLDDIYAISGFTQGNVTASAPLPTGPGNQDANYSPLWQVSVVTWVNGVTPHLLRSEQEIFAARDQGLVTIDKKNIVVNCPVIYTPTGGLLPNAEVSRKDNDLPELKSPF
jgi:hypothetical protein